MANASLVRTLNSQIKGISRASPPPTNPTCYRLSRHYYPYPLFPFSLKFSTSTPEPVQHPFTVSYLINNCGFSPESALNASKIVRFETPQKPDSVIAFFRSHGFSNPQICDMVKRAPWLLSCDPDKRVLPKFEFFLSKGASTSDIVRMVTKNPGVLQRSLENHVIPTYGLVKRFLLSDEKTIACISLSPFFFSHYLVPLNVKLLLDNGVTYSSIAYLLRTWPSILASCDMMKTVVELKELGFKPSKSTFVLGLLAKSALRKSQWDAKVDAFKSWGWSEENIVEAFRRRPNCMLASIDRINEVMSFWVNELGWSSLDLVKAPIIFAFNLEKRTIPRASVVQYLLSKGLRNKSASLLTPFVMSEKLFLQKFVKCFKEEETSQLLKLYQEKMNLSDIRGNRAM